MTGWPAPPLVARSPNGAAAGLVDSDRRSSRTAVPGPVLAGTRDVPIGLRRLGAASHPDPANPAGHRLRKRYSQSLSIHRTETTAGRRSAALSLGIDARGDEAHSSDSSRNAPKQEDQKTTEDRPFEHALPAQIRPSPTAHFRSHAVWAATTSPEFGFRL